MPLDRDSAQSTLLRFSIGAATKTPHSTPLEPQCLREHLAVSAFLYLMAVGVWRREARSAVRGTHRLRVPVPEKNNGSQTTKTPFLGVSRRARIPFAKISIPFAIFTFSGFPGPERSLFRTAQRRYGTCGENQKKVNGFGRGAAPQALIRRVFFG